MSERSTGRYKTRLLAELFALDNGDFDVDRLAAQFDVKPDTVLADFSMLRGFGFVDIYPVAEAGICDFCNKQGSRVTHHWTDEAGFHTKSLCRSCNAKLGQMFRGNYSTWEEQVRALNEKTQG